MGDQGVQQMQPPIVVYPNTYTKQYPSPPSSTSGSSGSFVTGFIVLAVIFVLSALACVFGRLCYRGSRLAKHKHTKHRKASSNKSREIRPLEREQRERGDFEFGFDMKQPEPRPMEREQRERGDLEFGFDMKQYELKEKPSRKDGEDIEYRERGGGSGQLRPSITHGVRFKLPENEDHQGKGEIRHGGPDFEFRPRH